MHLLLLTVSGLVLHAGGFSQGRHLGADLSVAAADAHEDLDSEPDGTYDQRLVVVALEGPHLPVAELPLFSGLILIVMSVIVVVLCLRQKE